MSNTKRSRTLKLQELGIGGTWVAEIHDGGTVKIERVHKGDLAVRYVVTSSKETKRMEFTRFIDAQEYARRIYGRAG